MFSKRKEIKRLAKEQQDRYKSFEQLQGAVMIIEGTSFMIKSICHPTDFRGVKQLEIILEETTGYKTDKIFKLVKEDYAKVQSIRNSKL